jgi:glucokinase
MKTKPRVVAALESSLIQHLRLRDGVSRVELARAMDVAPSTIGLYVDRLIRDGFLREGTKARGQTGRPPITLELNPRAGQFIGVDFEARQLSAVAVDFSQRILQRRRMAIKASDTAATVVEKIDEAIEAVAVQRRPLLGIGVAVPGTVDEKRGVAVHYQYIRGWRDVPLVEQLAKRFAVPIYLENNIRSMALAERWFGQCMDVDNFVCVGIRSGIGAGVVIKGQLYRGKSNLAGEIGGWAVGIDDNAAADGVATLEQHASVRAVLQQVSDAASSGEKTKLKVRAALKVSLDELLEAARNGDQLVCRVLREAGRSLGQMISQLNLLLSPEQIVIAGPLAGLGDIFLDPVREIVWRLTPPLHAQRPRIVASQLGDFGGALGAAAIAVHQFMPAR